jgi:hypothetical protein
VTADQTDVARVTRATSNPDKGEFMDELDHLVEKITADPDDGTLLLTYAARLEDAGHNTEANRIREYLQSEADTLARYPLPGQPMTDHQRRWRARVEDAAARDRRELARSIRRGLRLLRSTETDFPRPC